MPSENRQWSDWSTIQPVFIQRQNSILESNAKQKQKTNFRCKFFQDRTFMLPLLQGLLLGILVGCLSLSIVLALWLTQSKAGANMITTTTVTCVLLISNSDIPTSIYALTIPTCATWNQTGITVGGNQNGSFGSDLGSLNAPIGIFVDNSDNLVVADRDNHRIMKYYPNSNTGIIIAGNNTPGTSLFQLNQPRGVAVDRSGALIVADTSNYRIQKFVQGSLMGITLFSNTSLSPLGQIRNLYVDVNSNIYATDSDYSQVVTYTPYSSTAIVLAGGGTSGSASNELSNPYGSFMDVDNTLYVADTGNDRVMKYLYGSIVGILVAGINSSGGSGLNQLQNSMSVIVDNNGYIYVADSGNNRIMKWTTNYTVGGLCVVGCTGTIGSANDQLSSPRDLKFDQYGNLYVSDQRNNRVQKFMIQRTLSCNVNG